MLSQVKLKSGIDFCLNRQDSHEARNAKEYASSNEEGSGFKQKIKGIIGLVINVFYRARTLVVDR